MDVNTQKLIKIIESHGYTAFMVGGAVRDHIMHRPIKDVDLATDMPMENILQLFPSYDIGKNKDFGIMSIKFLGVHYEISKLRIGKLSDLDALSPEEKKSSLIREDSRYRDFTINAMAMDSRGKVYDTFNGIMDIQGRLIRATEDPDERIREDPLRMLRAVRFAVTLGFEVEPVTFVCIQQHSEKINKSALERVGNEIFQMASVSGKDFARGVELMDSLSLLPQVLPEIYELKKLPHNPKHHPEGGVYEHTLAALRSNEQSDPLINLAILCHDTGKAATFSLKDNQPVYYGHEKYSSETIQHIGKRLKFSQAAIDAMSFAALHHMSGLRINEMKLSKVYKLMSHKAWPILQAVIRSDIMSREKENVHWFDNEVKKIAQSLAQWKENQNKNTNSVISGREVMEYTGLAQGPKIGKIIEDTTSWAIDNNITDPDQIHGYVVRRYAGNNS